MKKFLVLFCLVFVAAFSAMAQITTASLSGKVTDDQNEDVFGATVVAVHQPSGTTYGTVTNASGRYAISGMRAGGPYSIRVSFVGYQTVVFENVNIPLGENLVQDAWIVPSSDVLDEVVVVGQANQGMRADRAGAGTHIAATQIAALPTVSRSMNDIMRMTPQGANTGNGFAVGGGNFRQSFVTVDGAAFNNAFGIGSNLPANGAPISLDALDQIAVSVTPFDVRQSGFTGGSINAVTKSGTNSYKASAYIYTNNVHLKGDHVGDYKLTRNRSNKTTYGVSVGGPIIKNKLFFFVNGEYEDNVSAGPAGTARKSATDEWKLSSGTVHRPTVAKMDEIASYLKTTYGYNPGRYQGYSLETPAYRILARLDWNINENNKLNVRFSATHTKDSNNPSASTSPLTANTIYPGGTDLEGVVYSRNNNRLSNAALYFESSRYYQERNFTSVAAEWNSKWGEVNNALRATYSYQEEPRSYEGSKFPTVDILEGGALYTSFGPDPFTEGNLREVKTFVVTDEVTWAAGVHNFLAGLQFETNKAANGFAQAANGYYVFSSWNDFVTGAKPAAYGVTYKLNSDGSVGFFTSEMTHQQYSAYVQDQMNLTDNFKLTAGLRMEATAYPSLSDNFNSAFANLKWRGGNGRYDADDNFKQYSTDQLPDTKISVSPRLGFNWDITGDRKYVLRGGTGYFVGRLPFVWLVSAVGNSNCGQLQYYYNTQSAATHGQPDFSTSITDQIGQLDAALSTYSSDHNVAPQSPTVIDKDLKMPAAWKSSLAFDVKLPAQIDASVEGIYSRDFNPAVVTNENYYWDGSNQVEIVPGDFRRVYKKVNNSNNAYLITNAGNKAYYYSITASLAKKFDFGLDAKIAYTFSKAKSYGDGIGDQVTSAYKTNRYSVNGMNDLETGYGTYVAPNRIIASVNYQKDYGKFFGTAVSLVWEGMNAGSVAGYQYARYSYVWNGNSIAGDGGSNSLLYIPASREELDSWNFVNQTLGTETYTADQQRDDFWAYINQDDYLKDRNGKYTERGGAIMPWRNQFDFRLTQNFYLPQHNGKKHTLQLGLDIENVGNLLNHDWGVYKQVRTMTLLSGSQASGIKFATDGKERLTKTYTDRTTFNSTYSMQFSVRYIFE